MELKLKKWGNKKKIIKLLKIIGVILLIIFTGLIIIIFFTGPALPDNTDTIIDNVMNSPLPEFVTGDSGYVTSNNYKIWYEFIKPKDSNNETILLFGGLSTDALGWSQSFIDNLTGYGYQVIRFDYRGTGMSDWVENWREKPYSLTDLSNDAVIILDTLEIEKVHLVGQSMGGMVGQEFAINNPNRTLTLTSIMSSGYISDEELPQVSGSLTFDFLKIGIKYGLFPSETNTIKLVLAAKVIVRGDAQYDVDVKGTAEQVLYNLRERNGYNPDVASQHDKASSLSGSRYDKLKDLETPVLVIHGINDPFVSIEHSKKLARILPNSKTKWFENMGHDLPPFLIESISNEIIEFIEEN